MLRKTPLFIVSLLCLLAATDLATAQDLHPSRRASPVGIAKTHLGDTYVKVVYSRPYVRNREIFGTNTDDKTFLVPFGQLWRTGANEATEITTTGPLTVAGQMLAAGTYSIFTEPGPNTWTVHISPQLGLDGTGRLSADGTFTPDVYDSSMDVLMFSVPSGMLEEPVDQFTISFEDADGGAHLVIQWEKTAERIPIAASS